MQFFLGLRVFNPKPLFSSSLFVEFRKRIGDQTFGTFSDMLIGLGYPEQNQPAQQESD